MPSMAVSAAIISETVSQALTVRILRRESICCPFSSSRETIRNSYEAPSSSASSGRVGFSSAHSASAQ